MAAALIPFRSGWRGAVLVCGKCSRKLGGGFGDGGRASLAKLLRRRFGLKKGRKAAVGVVETGCLKVCPKHGVAVVDTAEPGRWIVVREGTAIDAVAAALPSLQALPPA